MADVEKSGSNGWLAFVIGGLVVAVAVLGYFMYSGGMRPTDKHEYNLKIETPDLPKMPAAPSPPAPSNN